MTDETPPTEPEAPAEAVPAAVAAVDSGVTRLGLPDGSQSKPGKPFEKGGKGKAIVRVAWPHDSFEHGIKGVPAITAAGVEVDRSLADALNEAAATSGTYLEEIDE